MSHGLSIEAIIPAEDAAKLRELRSKAKRLDEAVEWFERACAFTFRNRNGSTQFAPVVIMYKILKGEK